MFKLEIRLANAEMQTTWHVGCALEALAARLMEDDVPMDGQSGIIGDINGNQVGTWEAVAD